MDTVVGEILVPPESVPWRGTPSAGVAWIPQQSRGSGGPGGYTRPWQRSLVIAPHFGGRSPGYSEAGERSGQD